MFEKENTADGTEAVRRPDECYFVSLVSTRGAHLVLLLVLTALLAACLGLWSFRLHLRLVSSFCDCSLRGWFSRIRHCVVSLWGWRGFFLRFLLGRSLLGLLLLFGGSFGFGSTIAVVGNGLWLSSALRLFWFRGLNVVAFVFDCGRPTALLLWSSGYFGCTASRVSPMDMLFALECLIPD